MRYEQSAAWKVYYQQIEPERRKELLDRLSREEADDGANALRRELYERRYVDPKDPSKKIDTWLWNCVCFPQIYKTTKIFRKGGRKEALAAVEAMGLGLAGQYGEAGKAAVYWEIRNAVRRYLATCQSSAYDRKIFGLMSSTPQEKTGRICRDMWEMSEGISRRLEIGEELALWNEAVRDEYAVQDEAALQRFTMYGEKAKSRLGR